MLILVTISSSVRLMASVLYKRKRAVSPSGQSSFTRIILYAGGHNGVSTKVGKAESSSVPRLLYAKNQRGQDEIPSVVLYYAKIGEHGLWNDEK